VDRLVKQAIADLKSHGVETTGKLPRQILRMAHAAKGRAPVPPKNKTT
jgi:hypothetical protein